ncbi:MAG: DUF3592 domain-containing protein [Acidobacteriota bacterium]
MFAIIDNIVVFLYWLIRQTIMDMQSSHWPVTEAIVLEARSLSTMYPRAAARYRFMVDGQQHEGRYDKGFWSSDSALRYADLLAATGQIQIRYNPASPSRSCLRSTDAIAPPLSARRTIF